MCLQDFSKDKIKSISRTFTLHCYQTIPLYNTWYFKLYKIQLNYYTQPKITRGIYVCTYIKYYYSYVLSNIPASRQSPILFKILIIRRSVDFPFRAILLLINRSTLSILKYCGRNTDVPVKGEVSAITPNPTQFSVNSSSSTWSRARSQYSSNSSNAAWVFIGSTLVAGAVQV